MRTNITIAEHVTVHDDGTFSLLRGGIDRFWGDPGEPVSVAGQLLVKIHADKDECGNYNFKLNVLDGESDKIEANIVEGEFTVPKGGGKSKFPLPFQLEIDEPGNYKLGFSINDEIKCQKRFEVETKKAEDSKGGIDEH